VRPNHCRILHETIANGGESRTAVQPVWTASRPGGKNGRKVATLHLGADLMRHGLLRMMTAIACFALVGVSTSARADAIDGNWCQANGKRMSIQGPEIVTPGGTQTRGDYSRHFFSYVIPAGESGAGETVSITLLSEYLAHARVGADPTVQEWRRCQPDVS
jgi:hypothetical protein